MVAYMDEIAVAKATVADIRDICEMRRAVLGWPLRQRYVRQAVVHGHAVVARDGDGRLVAFRYQQRLAPDTLGDGLTLVVPEWRGLGVGRRVVEEFERAASPRWRLSVVVNTDLLAAAATKPPATGFWTACGYRLAADTGSTRLLWRLLPPTGDAA